MMHDVFISHASEDKESVVLPLSEILKRSYGINVWVDINEIRLGTSLRRKIDHGLANSKFGVVILSPSFFNKEWPQKELDALVSREDGKHEIILPVLHNLNRDDVRKYSPLLADKLSVSTEIGLDRVAEKIVDVVFRSTKSIISSQFATTIGISGASCSGKSWFADKIRQQKPNDVTVFDLDSYYKAHSYVSTLEHRHDNPDSLNFEKAIEDLTLLKNGKDILVPEYDFETHSVIGEKLCKHNPLIVVEGVFVFYNPWFREKLDVKVWVSAEQDLKLDRRLRRDTNERGRTTEEVLDRYAKDVGPGFNKFIQPLKIHADIIYENNGRNKDKLPKAIELLIAYATR